MDATLDYLIKKVPDYGSASKLPLRIPNVTRLDLLRWLRELDFKTGVEVGVAEGVYSYLICETNPQMKLYGVDPWEPYGGYKDYVKKGTFERMEQAAIRRLAVYVPRGRYQFVKKFSVDALTDFKDGSLDFAYIDGNHQDPFVTQDIYDWSEKVRSGGIVAGHDYVRVKRVDWAVKDAIHKYTEEKGINPWFILGADEVVPRQLREGSRSWLFVKP